MQVITWLVFVVGQRLAANALLISNPSSLGPESVEGLVAAMKAGDVESMDRIYSSLRKEAEHRRKKSHEDEEQVSLSLHVGKGDPVDRVAKKTKTTPGLDKGDPADRVGNKAKTPPGLDKADPADRVAKKAKASPESKTDIQNPKKSLWHGVPEGMEKETTCILDDHVFALTPTAKAEVLKELESPEMVEALNWVRTGGWWFCSMYGETCTCTGDVRMVDWERKYESTIKVNTRSLQEKNVKCDLQSFGNQDVRPGFTKICECAHSQKDNEEGFHLHKRLSSTSYLQEAWITLLRLLGRTRLLPMGTGDRTHHGIQNWAARQVPGKMPMVLERVWLEMFVKQVVVPANLGPRCLEWGDPARPGSGFNYANMVPGCYDKVDMQYDPVFRKQKPISIEGNIVYSDIDHLPFVLMQNGDSRVNLIFATQVLEHLHNPEAAISRLMESLMPGGALVLTAPQQAQFHEVPHDFFRYTKQGVLHLLTNAGFCVPAWAFAGGGDFVFDIARDAGLQVQDFPNEEIVAGFQRGYDSVSDSAITIHVVAFKPPHLVCSTAMKDVVSWT